MKAIIDAFVFLWRTQVGTHWSYLVPILLLFTIIVWILVVYRKGNFRWLPALAITRVTVLDSVGRLEVVFLLLMGMLLIGVNGFVLFNPTTRDALLQQQGITHYLSGKLGNTGIEVSQQENEVMLADILGTAAMLEGELFIAIIGFVLAMFVLPNEIGRGVILSILPKPLTRAEYVVGKFIGIWIIVSGCFLVLAIELYLIEFVWFAMHSGQHFIWFNMKAHFPVNLPLLRAMCLFPFKYATLVLLIMGFSLRMPEAPAGIVGLAIFIAGHFSDRIYEMATNYATANQHFFAYGLKVGYWVLPHLTEVLSLTILDLDASLLNDSGVVWGWIWQIIIYNAILLWLLIVLFRRRSF